LPPKAPRLGSESTIEIPEERGENREMAQDPQPLKPQLFRGKPIRRMHVMVKPTGPLCNLNCTYCYYLSKQVMLTTESHWRISDEVLESFIRQYFEGQN
jgi:wyosine [tRNA(Phe)-imidazoG37] synthetase (radical SAM superfamily)